MPIEIQRDNASYGAESCAKKKGFPSGDKSGTTHGFPVSLQDAWEAYCEKIKDRGEHPGEAEAFRAGWNAAGEATKKVLEDL